MANQILIEPPREVRLKRKLNELELSWPDGLSLLSLHPGQALRPAQPD